MTIPNSMKHFSVATATAFSKVRLSWKHGASTCVRGHYLRRRYRRDADVIALSQNHLKPYSGAIDADL